MCFPLWYPATDKSKAAHSAPHRGSTEIGTIVNQLGDHLWYIFQDSKNNYWFGSDGEGLFRYDGAHTLQLTTEDGLSNNSIRQIREDQAGNMYFSTLGGIGMFKFNGDSFDRFMPTVLTE